MVSPEIAQLCPNSSLAAAIACFAGVLTAPVSLVDPLIGFIGIKAFAAAIVGGFGSLPGAIIGGLVIGVVEQIVGYFLLFYVIYCYFYFDFFGRLEFYGQIIC